MERGRGERERERRRESEKKRKKARKGERDREKKTAKKDSNRGYECKSMQSARGRESELGRDEEASESARKLQTVL